MDSSDEEEVQILDEEEVQVLDQISGGHQQNIYLAAMRLEFQEEKKTFREGLKRLYQSGVRSENEIHRRIGGVESNFLERMRNLDSEQASLNEKVNVLEEQLTTNKNRFEQKLQEMEVQNKIERARESRRRHSSSGIAGREGLLPLMEVQLQALMKGSDCVKSIGKLVLNLFPEGYFLESENTFTAGISRHQLDAIFEIVSSKFKEIKRRGHQHNQPLTKELMVEVIRIKVTSYRTRNKKLKK